MSIVSISGGELLPGIQQPNVLGQGQPSVSFGDFLNQAIEEVNASEAQAQQDILSIATGDADALHNITLNMAALWVDGENREKAQIFGHTVIDPLSVIITHLAEVVKKHAHELLTRSEVNRLLEHLPKEDKGLAEEFIPSVFSVGDLQRVLGNFLMEQIPIRDMPTILETMGTAAPTVKDPDLLTEYVRQALKRTITRKFTDDGALKVITVPNELESMILKSVKKNEHGSYIAMEPESMQKIVSAHLKEVERLEEMVKTPIVLTSPVVRLYYRKLIEEFSAEAVVLSFNEIEANVKVISVGQIAALA